MASIPRTSRLNKVLLGCSFLAMTAMAVNCSDQKQSESLKTRPAEQPAAGPADPGQAAQPTRPAEPAEGPPETGPEQPETRPQATQPESTYDSRPPYPVALFVRSPKEKQPGWLRIEELANTDQLATARGRFPEQNRIYVDTGNVRRVRIHVGHLPLKPNERVILQIDGQGMVISRSRPFTTLELSPTGVWEVVKAD